MRVMGYKWVMLGVIFAFGLSACATVRPVEDEPDEAVEEEVALVLSDYEDFDVEPYREAEPARAEISHDVPSVLMDNRAAQGSVRTVQGYRIQIASSVERREAVVAEEDAKSWWRTDGRADNPGVFGSDLPTYVVYLQPYYRVRIGDFTSRGDAQRALSAIERQFPGSFIVPDTVTIITR